MKPNTIRIHSISPLRFTTQLAATKGIVKLPERIKKTGMDEKQTKSVPSSSYFVKINTGKPLSFYSTGKTQKFLLLYIIFSMLDL